MLKTDQKRTKVVNPERCIHGNEHDAVVVYYVYSSGAVDERSMSDRTVW